MKLLGPCTFSQAALPHIFKEVDRSYHQHNMEVFERNAKVCYRMLKDAPGISPIMPAGAMYMMVSY
jgi:tyrosine aminotransferase